MKLIHAALLLHSAGKDITAENVQNVVDAAEIEVDEAEIKALVAALDGVDIDEAMEKGVAVQQAAPAQPSEEEAETEEEGGEEEAEEEEAAEEEAAEGLGTLF